MKRVSDKRDTSLEAAAGLLRALASPIRLAIVHELGTEPRCVHELVELLDASQPLVSQHLRVLRGARLVTTERRGKEVVYMLTDEHVSHIAFDAIRHSQEDHR
ncbi:MAG: helix-turn-helix transcriptional regulator [Actinobacteria bacterium]|nr:helix-turn-helix transcriptional regulator [Actinomycetota bacterium]